MVSILTYQFGLLHLGDASLLLFLVKATLILVCALCVTAVMHRAAAGARHLVWLVTLGGLLLVPALSMWSPLRLTILPARTSMLASVANAPAPVAVPLPGENSSATKTDNETGSTQSTLVPDAAKSVVSPIVTVKNADPVVILFGIWFTVALAIGLSLAYATHSLSRVVRASKPLNNQEWLNAIWDVSDRLGLAHTPRLRQSTETTMPFACGLLHPTIVLPAESEGWSPERRRAVLLHELAHVRRRDLFGHTLGRIACAVYWFHPLVWTAAKRLRSESERACDDLALICGTRAADYAEHLLDIVTSVRRDRTPTVALAMARRKEFEGRMLAILDPELQRATPGRGKIGTLVGSLGLLCLVVGAAAPVSRRQAVTPLSGVDSRGANRTAHHASDTGPIPDVRAAISHFATGVATSVTSNVNTNAGTPSVHALNDGLDASASVDARIAPFLVHAFDSAASGTTPDERATLLAKILQADTSAALRHTAAWGLAQYAELPVATTALTNALGHDANESVRETSAWALARDHVPTPAVVQALTVALRSDASDAVRATSAWALGEVHGDAAISALTTSLADRSPAVRMRALWAIGVLRPATAPGAVVARLKDADSNVRELAAWALYRIRDTSSVPALESALRVEANRDLQADYIHAMAAMGDESVGAIRGLLESPDAKLKTMAVTVLAGGQASGPWPWPWPDPRPFP